jgi:predicted Co/Zn/Cd cation transporter (cation efflux family)
MRLEDKTLSFMVNFLLGVAWAFSLLGAMIAFLSFYSDSFFLALIAAFIAAIPGFMFILLLEHFITNKEKLYELKKQTKLLKDSLNK